jgi:hypothetical protein
MNKLKI